MKKGQYYFDKLSEVEQKDFVKNLDCDETIEQYLLDEYKSFRDFIGCAFVWDAECNEFNWDEIANRKVD